MTKRLLLSVFTISVMSALALASPVAVTFLGPSTGANNGSVYVGPYNLTVDGTPTLGTCISWDLEVGPPWTWDAEVVAPATSLQDGDNIDVVKLLRAGWLNQQFADSSDWVGIHEAIWGIFGAPFTDADTLAWEQLALENYGSVDPGSFSVLVPEQSGYAQSFLVENSVPEPTTLMFGGLGLMALGLMKRRQRNGN